MTMPSGSAPEGYKADQLDGTVLGAGFSSLASRTQANVTAQKKSEVTGIGHPLRDFTDIIWEGLDPNIPLPLAILKAVGKALGLAAMGIVETVVDWIAAIPEIFNAAGDFVAGIGDAIVDGVESVADFLSSLWQAFTGIADSSPKSVSQVKAAGGGLAGVANNASLTAGTAITNATTANGNAIDAQEASAANAAEIAQIRALSTGTTNSGNSGFDNFEYALTFNNSGGSTSVWSWTGSGTGNVNTDGAKMYWQDSGSGSGVWLGRFKGATTVTSYQAITTVLQSPLTESPIFGGAQAYLYLIGRSNVSMSDFVYLKIGYNTLSLWKIVGGGTDIAIGSPVTYSPKVGDSIQLLLGTGADIRQFKVLVNNKQVMAWTDSTFYGGNLSVENASTHNHSGAAFFASPRAGGGQSTPGALAIFSLADNAPAPLVGSGIRVYRSDTNTADLSTGTNIFPLGWFGQVDYKTPDITYDSQTGKVTVDVEGWYHVVLQQHGDSSVGIGAGGQARAVLWKGTGAGARQDVMHGFGQTWNLNVGFTGISGTFLIYLKKGDWVEPGYYSAASGNDLLKADSAGKLTWFSVTLANRSLA